MRKPRRDEALEHIVQQGKAVSSGRRQQDIESWDVDPFDALGHEPLLQCHAESPISLVGTRSAEREVARADASAVMVSLVEELAACRVVAHLHHPEMLLHGPWSTQLVSKSTLSLLLLPRFELFVRIQLSDNFVYELNSTTARIIYG